MKVGAGGLQSMLTYDAIAARKVDPAQARPAQVEEQNLLGRQVMALEDLVRMVEHLNRLAEMSNYPYRFRVRDKEREQDKKQRPRVALVDCDGRHQRFLTEDELADAAAGLDAGDDAALLRGGFGLNTEV